MTASTPLAALAAALAAARRGDADGLALAAHLRGAAAAVGARLSPRAAHAAAEIAMRLESSAMFAGESCSFSARDLHDAVDAWLAHAAARGGGASGPDAAPTVSQPGVPT